MKLIVAMKTIKELQLKAQDLRDKVQKHCANLSFETPVYENQSEQVKQWIQAHTDINREILKLRFAIQKTNVATDVTIELGGKSVTKTIAEWIHRRRDLAKLDMEMWSALTDRGLKEQNVQATPGGQVTEVRIRRYYDPLRRDQMIELYRAEPNIIDRTLEVVNATTEVVA